MKPCVKKWAIYVLIGFGLIWSGLAYSDDLVGVPVDKQVKVTATAPRKNRTTGTYDTTVTLMNRSRPKHVVHGPVTLVVSRRPAGITLANGSGQTPDGRPYLNIPLPKNRLNAGQKAGGIVLRFNNPGQKKFTVH